MIRLAPCSCCDGYIVQCDHCSKQSGTCSGADPVEAAKHARGKGWKTYYPSVTAPATWLCANCFNK